MLHYDKGEKGMLVLASEASLQAAARHADGGHVQFDGASRAPAVFQALVVRDGVEDGSVFCGRVSGDWRREECCDSENARYDLAGQRGLLGC